MKKQVFLFEQKYVERLNALSDLKKKMTKLEDLEKSIKVELEKAMDEYGITSVNTDKITISRIAESVSTSINTKALKKAEPKLYKELLADYPKTTTKKAFLKVTVK